MYERHLHNPGRPPTPDPRDIMLLSKRAFEIRMKDWRDALGLVPPPLASTGSRAWVWYRNGPHWRADNAWRTMRAPEYVNIQGEGPLPQPQEGEGPQPVSLCPRVLMSCVHIEGDGPQEAGLQPQREPQPQRERCCSRRRREPQPQREPSRRRREPQPQREPSRSVSPETWAKREMHRAAGVAFVRRSADYRAVLAHGPSAVARPQTPDPTVRSGKREWERSMQNWRNALARLVLVHNLTAPVDEDLRAAVRARLLELTP